jgi:hypothetical protein
MFQHCEQASAEGPEGKCPRLAAYRYTWPGRDEAFICAAHAYAIRRIAEAMGLPLQVISLPDPEER